MSEDLSGLLLRLDGVAGKAGEEAVAEEVRRLVASQPLLLDGEELRQAVNAAASSSSAGQEQAEAVVAALLGLRAQLLDHPLDYPLGSGPLERLWESVWSGQITPEYGQACAREEVAGCLTDVYALAATAYSLEVAHAGDWDRALQIERLLLAAARQDPPVEAVARLGAARRVAEREWLEVARAIVASLPHPQVYREAVECGERLLAGAVAPALTDQDRALVLFRLGTLHLEPYTADKSSGSYEHGIRAWNRRLTDALGADEASRLLSQYGPLPSPTDALGLAEGWLRSALAISSGPDRGLCAKALCQTLHWSGLLGESVADEEIRNIGRVALEELPGIAFAHERASVLAILVDHGHQVESEVLDELLAPSLDEVVRQSGPMAALDLLIQSMDVLWRTDPGRALEIARAGRSLVQTWGDETRQQVHWVEEVRLLVEVHAAADLPDTGIGTLEQRAAAVRERAQREEWDLRRLSASLIGLAAAAAETDEESAAFPLVLETVDIAPLLAADFDDALAFFHAELAFGAGAVALQAGAARQAVAWFGTALHAYCGIGQAEPVGDCLDRLLQLAATDLADLPNLLVEVLAPVALEVERLVGESGTRRLQRLYESIADVLAGQPSGTESIEQLLILAQLANGHRLASVLRGADTVVPAEDDEGRRLLAEIQRDEILIGADQDAAAPQWEVDEELLLSTYVRPGPERPGQTAAERLANLRRAYDAHLDALLLPSVAQPASRLLTSADLGRLLDDTTVLVFVMIGSQDGTSAQIHLVAATDDEVAAASGEYSIEPNGDDDNEDGAEQSTENEEVLAIARLVAATRNAVQDDPGARRVTRRAQRLLETAGRHLLGPLESTLAQWRATGRTNLVVVPHGPLQYFPFHLLQMDGRALSDDWTVTYLPNPALVTTLSERSDPPGRHTTAVGLSFASTGAALPEAVAECQTVAALTGGRTLLDQEATSGGLLEVLASSRSVHLATHGRHAVTAPAFQYLRTADGRVHAHEVVRCDLRGLSLLTLAACETALGRVDSAGNLRGLPASFLIAGAATLVATLWPAETEASQRFFTVLYDELVSGAERRVAFQRAQSATRADFPDYRDWGAFALQGTCR